MSECTNLGNVVSKTGRTLKQGITKYAYRNSPPYPANKCHNKKKKGNDGKMYISQADKNGIFTPLNIYNGTTKGCPTRYLMATVTDKWIEWNAPKVASPISNLHRCKWVSIKRGKTEKQKVKTEDLKKLALKYQVTTSGSKSDLASRLVKLRGHQINKTDMQIIEEFI